MLRITLVLFLVGETVAQITSNLRCPVLLAVKDFDVDRFGGKWYEFAKYADQKKMTTKCVMAIHVPYDSDSFDITYYEAALHGGQMSMTDFRATSTSLGHYGLFKLDPDGAIYWILPTDYKNWALVWSCTDIQGGSTRECRILTRTRNPFEQLIKWVYAMVDVKNLHRRRFVETIKTGCPPYYYLPGN